MIAFHKATVKSQLQLSHFVLPAQGRHWSYEEQTIILIEYIFCCYSHSQVHLITIINKNEKSFTYKSLAIISELGGHGEAQRNNSYLLFGSPLYIVLINHTSNKYFWRKKITWTESWMSGWEGNLNWRIVVLNGYGWHF